MISCFVKWSRAGGVQYENSAQDGPGREADPPPWGCSLELRKARKSEFFLSFGP
jgi:hypothetical protein